MPQEEGQSSAAEARALHHVCAHKWQSLSAPFVLKKMPVKPLLNSTAVTMCAHAGAISTPLQAQSQLTEPHCHLVPSPPKKESTGSQSQVLKLISVRRMQMKLQLRESGEVPAGLPIPENDKQFLPQPALFMPKG